MSLTVPLAIALRDTSGNDTFITSQARDLTFGSRVPGGFQYAQVPLNRRIDFDVREFALYSDLIIYNAGSREIVWQGRLEDPTRSQSDDGSIWALQAIGGSAHTMDRRVPLVYVDRILDSRSWIRRTSSVRAGQIGVEQDGTTAGALKAECPEGTTANQNAWEVGWIYTSLSESGQKLARFDYTWDAGRTDSGWRLQAITDASGTLVRNEGFNTAGSGSLAKVIGTDFTNGDNQLTLRIRRTGSSVTAAVDTWGLFKGVYVMAVRYNADGSEKTTGYTSSSVLSSEVVKDLLGRLLTKYDGANASVATTTYGIDQLAYPDGATSAQILDDLIALEGNYYWAAWEWTDPFASSPKWRFEWKQWPSSVAYEADTTDGFNAPGSSVELFNEASVRWRDSNGRIRTATRTRACALLDAAGLTRTALIDLGDAVGSSANANQAGDQFLNEHNLPPNAGILTIRRPIDDLTMGRRIQPWEIRPGNLIRVRGINARVDALNPTDRDGSTVFRIVETDYQASTNTATLTLDSRPRSTRYMLDTLLKRFDARRRR